MKYLVLIAMLVGVAHAEIKTGDRFVELDAKTSKGKKFRLKDMSGKWVLYTFGASWCQPCHKELPAWDSIAPKFSGKVLFVAVNINNKEDEGKAFIDSLKLKHIFPVFMPDENSPAMKAYDPDRMPSTFVIDPQGVVRIVQYGYDKGDEDKLAVKLSELTK
jgi:cytochrome c biogenesis protein CcmG, thiol:disulfide interchange protein DsbE